MLVRDDSAFVHADCACHVVVTRCSASEHSVRNMNFSTCIKIARLWSGAPLTLQRCVSRNRRRHLNNWLLACGVILPKERHGSIHGEQLPQTVDLFILQV